MLKDFAKAIPPEKEQIKEELKVQRERLAGYQMKIKEAKLPVMVMFEGWGAAGKGGAISRVIKNIDPRFFRVKTMKASPTPEERRFPFLHRYMLEIPEGGKFGFFDTYWMEEVTDQLMEGRLDDDTFRQRMRSIVTAERSLVDNGYLILKFFLHIDKKEQKRRLKDLLADENTSWRVNEDDLHENNHYDEYLEVYDRYLIDTNNSSAPWYIIDSTDRKWAELQVLHEEGMGRMRTYVVRLGAEEARRRMEALGADYIEVAPLSLEEVFIYELGGADNVADIIL